MNTVMRSFVTDWKYLPFNILCNSSQVNINMQPQLSDMAVVNLFIFLYGWPRLYERL